MNQSSPTWLLRRRTAPGLVSAANKQREVTGVDSIQKSNLDVSIVVDERVEGGGMRRDGAQSPDCGVKCPVSQAPFMQLSLVFLFNRGDSQTFVFF